jgi:hypothetical protein
MKVGPCAFQSFGVFKDDSVNSVFHAVGRVAPRAPSRTTGGPTATLDESLRDRIERLSEATCPADLSSMRRARSDAPYL